MKIPPLIVSLFAFLFIVVGTACCPPGTVRSPSGTESLSAGKQSVKVNVTRQGYDRHRPWQQRSSSSRTGVGAIVPYSAGKGVLVTASAFKDYRYVEIEIPETGEKCPASVASIDYEANLALLVPQEPGFLGNSEVLDLTTDAVTGDELIVRQVGPRGEVLSSRGPITEIEIAQYSHGNYFLTYRVKNSLQYGSDYFTFPVIKEGQLAGLVMGYNPETQTIEVTAAPVLEHFLKDSADGRYEGFPKAGITTVSVLDPQLRHYLHMPEGNGGVYVEEVAKGSPAEESGMLEGDVILKVDGSPVDSHCRYAHPLYGRIHIGHLIRCRFYSGQTVQLEILRNGRVRILDLHLRHRSAEDYLVPPYIKGQKAPRYYILGGLLLQELNLPFLREYGPEWRHAAPMRLVYYAVKQDSLDKEQRKRIVFLSEVFPTSYTIGYEGLSNLVVESINGVVIGELEDVTRALTSPVNGFHEIRLEQRPGVIYLDPEEIPKIDDQILSRYGLPALKNLD